jgi:hypothetical protein
MNNLGDDMKQIDILKKALTTDEPSQCQVALYHLYKYGWISNVTAVRNLFILRLSERIRELNKMGLQIINTEPLGKCAIYKFDNDFAETLRKEMSE